MSAHGKQISHFITSSLKKTSGSLRKQKKAPQIETTAVSVNQWIWQLKHKFKMYQKAW